MKTNTTHQPVPTPVYEYSTAYICGDCAMFHANGDLSGIDDADRIAEIEACNVPVFVGDDVVDFSWSPCGACGTRLGGTRFAALIEIG